MEENFDIKEIYTPLSVAKKEIWRRWNDKELRKKVEDFLGGDIPDFLKNEPRGLLVRQITSPDREFFLFLDLLKVINIEPLFVEFRDDKFTSCNPDKYYRGNLFFFDGVGKNGGNKIKSKKIVDIDLFDGEKIKDVKTFQGDSLLDFHHKLIGKVYPSALNNIVDVSEWTKKNGKTADKYYLKYLAWFICHGILFENFSTSKKEIKFTRKLVLLNVRKLEKKLGVKPLIVPIVSNEDQGDALWWYYPKKIEEMVIH